MLLFTMFPINKQFSNCVINLSRRHIAANSPSVDIHNDRLALQCPKLSDIEFASCIGG